MPRARKDYKNISIKMDSHVHSMLVHYASDKGQSLTTAIERILYERLESEGYGGKAESIGSWGKIGKKVEN